MFKGSKGVDLNNELDILNVDIFIKYYRIL